MMLQSAATHFATELVNFSVVAFLIRLPDSASVGWRSALTLALAATLTEELVRTCLVFK